MTERRYYEDSYTTQFNAQIVERLEHDGKPAVILDQTYFYPTSGGQPNDTGTINGVAVVDVIARDEDGAVLHILAQVVEDDAVSAQVDWARRFDLMQHHTGQHILSQAFVQTANAKTVGFHLSPESITIDLDVTGLSDEQIDTAEMLSNQIIWENRAVTASLHDMDDQDGVRMRKLPKHILTEGLRVVEVAGFDVTACGGTHVAHTGEIGMIKVLKLEKRGGKTRVEFRCGARALTDLREKNRVANRIAADLDCRVAEAPTLLAKLRDDYKTMAGTLKAAQSQLIEYEAAKLLSETAPSANGIRLITAAFKGRDASELKLLASTLVMTDNVIVLLGTAGDKAMLTFARSQNTPQDVGKLLKETLTAVGGRGGGQPHFAQGGGMALDLANLQKALKTAEESLKI